MIGRTQRSWTDLSGPVTTIWKISNVGSGCAFLSLPPIPWQFQDLIYRVPGGGWAVVPEEECVKGVLRRNFAEVLPDFSPSNVFQDLFISCDHSILSQAVPFKMNHTNVIILYIIYNGNEVIM